MLLFLDTAERKEIEELVKTGFVDGITTNPSLLAKSEGEQKAILQEICHMVEGPVSIEVTAEKYDAIIRQGCNLAAMSPNVVVKVPMTYAGLKACRALRKEHICVNVTLCFSLTQAMLAAHAGATYVSPFIGRLEDRGEDGITLLEDINTYYTQAGWKTIILAASVRSLLHVTQVALAGAGAATMPPKIFRAMIAHPLTEKGLDIFAHDSKKTTNDHLGDS